MTARTAGVFAILAALLGTQAALAQSAPEAAPQAAAEPAPAPPGIQVPGLHLEGLQAYAGRPLVAFYVSAREATLGVSGQSLFYRDVRTAPLETKIDPSGQAEIPATVVPKGHFKVFNYVVLAVARQSAGQYYLRNTDGTFPTDPRATEAELAKAPETDVRYDRVGFVSTQLLNQLRSAQPSGDLTLRAGAQF